MTSRGGHSPPAAAASPWSSSHCAASNVRTMCRYRFLLTVRPSPPGLPPEWERCYKRNSVCGNFAAASRHTSRLYLFTAPASGAGDVLGEVLARVVAPAGGEGTPVVQRVDEVAGACSEDGGYPYFCTEDEANAASPDGTSHEHHGYWMPLGVTMYHGDFDGVAPACGALEPNPSLSLLPVDGVLPVGFAVGSAFNGSDISV